MTDTFDYEMALKDMEKETMRDEAKNNTAAEAVQMQHKSIKKAIELLQGQLDGMTDTVDPDTASWKDVSIFAKTADLARALCEAHAS